MSSIAQRTWPEPGQTCTNWRGCSEPALPCRWSCARHAERLERLGEELRQANERAVRRNERGGQSRPPFSPSLLTQGGIDRTVAPERIHRLKSAFGAASPVETRRRSSA